MEIITPLLSLVLETHHRLSSSGLSLKHWFPYFALALLGYFLLMFQSSSILSLNTVPKNFLGDWSSVSTSCSWLKFCSCLPQHHRGSKHCFVNDNSTFLLVPLSSLSISIISPSILWERKLPWWYWWACLRIHISVFWEAFFMLLGSVRSGGQNMGHIDK